MPKIPDLLHVKNAAEHNIEDAMFCVTMQPTTNDMAVITPEQLMMSCGTKDLDHLGITGIKIHDAHITGDPLGASGVVFSGRDPLPSAFRATHIDATSPTVASQTADCVHVVATAGGLNHPITMNIGPSKDELNVHPAEFARLGIARAARWADLHHSEVDNSPDIQKFEQGSETRHLIPLEVTETSSPMAKLWKFNESNRDFMGGRYLKQNRTEVNGGIVVKGDDFAAGQELLRANLKPKSNFAETGLVITAVPVLGQAHTTGQMHLRFSLLRKPLKMDELKSGMKSSSAAAHDNVFSVSDAQLALGEKPDEVRKAELTGGDELSATHADVFSAKLK